MLKKILKSLSSSVGFTALVLFLAVSSVSTLFFSFLDYHRQLNEQTGQLQKRLDLIQKTHLNTLSNAIWKVDAIQTDIILNSLLNLDDVTMVNVYSNGKLEYSYGVDTSGKDKIIRLFPLQVIWDGKKQVLGELEIIASQKHMKNLLRGEIKFYIITEFLKVSLFVFFAFIFIKLIITRHIDTITNYFKDKDFYGDRNRLKLNREIEVWKTSEDNFDILVTSINQMIDKLQLELYARLETEKKLLDLNEDLEHRVEEKTRELLDSHRMEAVAEMSSGIMHEINSPLSVIYGASKRMSKLEEKGLLDHVEIKKLNSLLYSATTRIFTITGALDILSYTSDPREVETFDLEELINSSMNSIFELFRPMFSDLSYELKANSMKICINKYLFSQLLFILTHLKSKHLQYVKESNLRILFLIDKESLIISTVDNGPAMNAEEIRFLKDPFLGVKERSSGSLLMWGTVSSIINKLNGKVEMKENSSLEIILPLFKEKYGKIER